MNIEPINLVKDMMKLNLIKFKQLKALYILVKSMNFGIIIEVKNGIFIFMGR